MAPPSLSTYQAAANDIYDPMASADITQSKADTTAKIANLEAGKGQINTDYTDAVNNLKQSILEQTGKIRQLYSERLGGMFSGLEGNDMGGMFAKANQQQSVIEQTRANKLAAITTGETNLQNAEIANETAINQKYRGEKAKYTNDSYASAVKDYNDTQYKNAELDLRRASLAETQRHNYASESKASAGDTKLGVAHTIAAKLESMTGSNGGQHAGDNYVSPKTYATQKRAWVNAGYSAAEFDTRFSNYRNPKNSSYVLSKSSSADVINALLGGS